MSLHTICDKCMKVIDQGEPWVQITEATLQEQEGTITTVTAAATYDFHPNHAPKLVKGQPEEPESPEPDQELPT